MPKANTETCIVRVPTLVSLSKNTDWMLNLNNYRNAHFQVLNKAKVNFKNSVYDDIQKLPIFKKIESIEYTLYRDSRRNCDVANVCSIVDKFFCDALVEAGKLPDDNYHYLKNVSYLWGGILTDKTKSYVEIKLTGTTEMKLNLTLDQTDIISAIKSYVSNAYPDLAETIAKSNIELNTARGGNVSCDITINNGIEANTAKSDSNSRSSSRVSGVRHVQDKQSEPAEPVQEEVPAVAEENQETAKAEEPTSVPDTKPDMEPAASGTSEEEKPVRKPLFGKRKDPEANSTNPDSSMGGNTNTSDPDSKFVSDSMGVEHEINNSDDGNPAANQNVGLSIFGRKKKTA